MQEDRALLKRWREGDGKAGEELFRRHFADVFRFFDSKVSAHAEELTQQTFVACLKSPEGLSREPSFRCFLFAIAWTALQRHLSSELNNEPVDFAVSSLNDITGRIGSPSSQLHRAQQSQFVHQALARLPAKQQILLEYCYWHNLDDAALADIFGVDAETIPDLLLRARKALRAQLTGASPGLQTAESADALTNSLLQHEDEDRGGVDSVDEKGKSR
jgi:RNA polymerase sigma factor (sigma-70 family)